MTGCIGIKEANGNFYPLLEENLAARKRLVLTTAHDNQKSVQIDLYKSNTKSMSDALYIGSLVVKNIAPKAKRGASIEMILDSDGEGSVSVDVIDLEDRSNEHHLSISLDSLKEDLIDYAAFDMDGANNEENRYKKRQAGSWKGKILWQVILIAGAALVLLCLAFFFLFRKLATGSFPTGSFPTGPKTAERTTVIERPLEANPQAITDRAVERAGSRNSSQLSPEGITYKVRWGDTLWDISEAFYRNPRLYPVIVRSNDISDPSLVVSGTELTIFPQK